MTTMKTKKIVIFSFACALMQLTTFDASAYGCARGAAGGVRVGGYGGVGVGGYGGVYNAGGYGSYPYGGYYGAGFAAGGGPAALVGGPEENPDYVPIPPAPPVDTAPPVDPMDQGIQYGPYSPGVYSRPIAESGTPL